MNELRPAAVDVTAGILKVAWTKGSRACRLANSPCALPIWDTPSEIGLLVKASPAGSVGSAQGRIDNFIKSVPATGRALSEKRGRITLTIVNPDQYRDQIIKLIAAEALKSAAAFAPGYGVEVAGLSEQLIWAQASATEVFLYIPYRFTIRPR